MAFQFKLKMLNGVEVRILYMTAKLSTQMHSYFETGKNKLLTKVESSLLSKIALYGA